MNKTNKIADGLAWMTSASIIASLLRVFSSIFLPKLLGVNIYGLMNLASSIQEIAGAAQLGTLKGLQIVLPQLLGENKYKESKKILNVILTMGIIIFIPVIIFLFTMKFFDVNPFNELNYLIITLISGALINNIFCQILINDLIAQGKYSFRAKWQIIMPFISTILVIPAAYFYQLEGVMLSSFLVQFFCLLFVIYKLRYKFSFMIDISIFKNVVMKGIAIELISFTYKSFKNLDLLFIGIFMMIASVGIYGFAYTAVMSVSLMVDPAHVIIKREVIFNHAKDGKINKVLMELIGYPLIIYMIVLFMSMLGAFFLIKILIDVYLTSFEGSFHIFSILLLGVPSLKIRGFFLPIYAAEKNLYHITKIHVLALLVKILVLISLAIFIQGHSEVMLEYLAYGNIFLVTMLAAYMAYDTAKEFPLIKKILFFTLARLSIILCVLSYYCVLFGNTLNYSNFSEIEILKVFLIIFVGLISVVVLFIIMFREYNLVSFTLKILKPTLNRFNFK